MATGKAYLYDAQGNSQETEIPEDMRDAYETAREELFNAAAEHDDALVEKFLEEGELTYRGDHPGDPDRRARSHLLPHLRGERRRRRHRACARCCTASRSTCRRATCGRRWSSVDSSDAETELATGADAPTFARVFKVSIEKDAGEFSLMRCFAGSIEAGNEYRNSTHDRTERVTQLFSLEGKNREKIERIGCGDFGAAVKLKDTHCGDTLADKSIDAHLPPIDYPEPTSRVAMRPVKDGEDDKVAQGLARIHEEDPTFKFGQDPETHRWCSRAWARCTSTSSSSAWPAATAPRSPVTNRGSPTGRRSSPRSRSTPATRSSRAAAGSSPTSTSASSR